MPTSTYTATLITRKPTATSNAMTNAACQEFYSQSSPYVGIIHFPGLDLTNKAISSISLTAVSAQAGQDAVKTVYLRESNYQDTTTAATGEAYAGELLGTFDGRFYNNTVTTELNGDLLEAVGQYLAQGNNTFTIYNPDAVKLSAGYSSNYLKWTSVTMTVTYTNAVSKPSIPSDTAELASALVISTNAITGAALHTLSYDFCGQTGIIAENVGDRCTWYIPVSLGSAIPDSVSAICYIRCDTYVNDVFQGSSTISVTLTVPDTFTPFIFGITVAEATPGLYERYGAYIRTMSTLAVSITGQGVAGSEIMAYRTVVDWVVYNSSSFTTNPINTAGRVTLTVTITDSRGRNKSESRTITVSDYSPPSLTGLTAERCNADGTERQYDGEHIRCSVSGAISSLGDINDAACVVYYRQNGALAWTQTTVIPVSDYAVTAQNILLDAVFDTLYSYEIMVRLSDSFNTVEQSVGIGTKTVLMDFLSSGDGIAFGKIAETAGRVEFGLPVFLSSALAVNQGGTGAKNAADACENIGAVKKTGDTMTGDLTISKSLPKFSIKPAGNMGVITIDSPVRYVTALSSWHNDSESNGRSLRLQSSFYGINNALMLRNRISGNDTDYHIFHEGMTTGIPIRNGGTGATSAVDARANLGCDNAENITCGIIDAERLPFRIAYGSAQCSGSVTAVIDYSDAGFSAVPCVVASYSTTGSNWSGDNGALKIYAKTSTGCSIIVGGSFSTKRNIDWIAVGV